ncbi:MULTISPECIES: type I-E CRISPR-associated protein Cas6/Cse3/CasE [unclassified Streptomyces]|uniref:type I-E CRISPR-associated protein Cas6/Cse3/CasE n=1 Tax=unclassified Streptomyces TaxID=2593676 RepID=UPI000CD55D26|nr:MULTISPECIES: type I-E CRISPR-associated protein Cas6/Cse3/CasE [unclassified Streptomyces]
MYLTRFRINGVRSGARRLLSSPHRVHGAVNAAFPELPHRDGDRPRVLWRLDHDQQSRASLFVVSPDRPDFTHLVEQVGWPTLEPGWQSYAYTEFLDALAPGDIWAFRLTANPVRHTRREKDPVGTPTKRTAHRTPAHQKAWLLKQQDRGGFEVVEKPKERRLLEYGDEHELVLRDHSPSRFRREPGAAVGNDVRFTQVTFDGRLRITDVAKLRTAMTQGIGKAKAYGCGLLTLAPVAPVQAVAPGGRR